VEPLGVTKPRSLIYKTCVSPKILKPCHYISFLGTLHPPIICRAKSAALVSFTCRVARSLVPSPLHSALLLGLSLPGLPTWSRRHHVPLYTAVQPGHGDSTSPLYTAVQTRSWPQRHFGHVPRLRPARVTCQHLLLCGVLLAHRAPRMGPALVQRIPQDLERVAVRLPDGNGLGQGPCSAQSDLVPSKTSASRPSVASTTTGHGTQRPESPA